MFKNAAEAVRQGFKSLDSYDEWGNYDDTGVEAEPDSPTTIYEVGFKEIVLQIGENPITHNDLREAFYLGIHLGYADALRVIQRCREQGESDHRAMRDSILGRIPHE